jgi:putative hydrolase of HD superfamily
MEESKLEPEPPRPQNSTRIFPPLYKSTGDASRDRLAFVHILEQLKVSTHGVKYCVILQYIDCKTQKRTGWVDHNVGIVLLLPKLILLTCTRFQALRGKLSVCFCLLMTQTHPDVSISDHMYRMAMLAMCSSNSELDIPKCVHCVSRNLWQS